MRNNLAPEKVVVNGRAYALPQRPVAVVCLDGCDPDYLAAGLAAGELPGFARIVQEGFAGEALSALPSFTNPNNCSHRHRRAAFGAWRLRQFLSGSPYRRDGDGDGRQGAQGAHHPRGAWPRPACPRPSSPPRTSSAARSRKACRSGPWASPSPRRMPMPRGWRRMGSMICRASWGAGSPINIPPISPSSCSMPACGCWKQGRARLLYLSLSDYVQHGYAPEEPEARDFHRAVDARLRRLMELGCLVAATADHGMHDMAKPDGTPNVIFVGDVLDAAVRRRQLPGDLPDHRSLRPPSRCARRLRAGAYRRGRSGGCARWWRIFPPCRRCREVLTGAEACARYDLAPEMEGDVTVIARLGVALGARAAEHDLSGLAGERLRSHGGIAEQRVPFLVSAPLDPAWRAAHPRLRNYDIFDAALNGAAA